MVKKNFILIFHPTVGTPVFNFGCSESCKTRVYKYTNVYICTAEINIKNANRPKPSVK
jgi:hypothetical protein